MLSKEVRAMKNEAAGSAPGKMPYEAALVEVVKGLHRDPVLLFGIGAGIVVVGALATTSSLPLVLIVAGLFVVVLSARAHQQAQAVRDIDVKSRFSRIKRNKFFGKLRLLSWFSSVEDNEFESPGTTRSRRPPEG
jgi:hypothetical protein